MDNKTVAYDALDEPGSGSVQDRGRNGIQVIKRAVQILRVLQKDSSGMSLGQVAKAVELPRSTVHRIIGALQRERFVISGAGGSDLRLGPEITALAEAARLNVVEVCRPLLSELSRTTGETCDLSVLRGSSMIFLDQMQGTHRLRTVSSIGKEFPLTATANGKACLAQLPPAHARQLVEAEWKRLNFASEISTFMSNLDDTRESGLAYDLDEHTFGISAIGFAFTDRKGDLHSISVPVPSTRFEFVREHVEEALRTAMVGVIEKIGLHRDTSFPIPIKGSKANRIPQA